MKIRDSVVASVCTAIQNGAIITIAFLECSPMCPRSKMVQWYTNPHTIFSYYQPLCLKVIPKRLAKILEKSSTKKMD